MNQDDKPLYPPLIDGEVSVTEVPEDPAENFTCEGCS